MLPLSGELDKYNTGPLPCQAFFDDFFRGFFYHYPWGSGAYSDGICRPGASAPGPYRGYVPLPGVVHQLDLLPGGAGEEYVLHAVGEEIRGGAHGADLHALGPQFFHNGLDPLHLQGDVVHRAAGLGIARRDELDDETAVKLRAEDGRSIRNTDISLFIDHLPGGKRGAGFTTENASGSTSQAANTIEAIEAGSRLFLIDEDTCATNFMIRDALMEKVVRREQEPITPFLNRIRPLYEEAGISVILVAGSSGLFFEKADLVIQMDNYLPFDITERAKNAAREAAAGGAAANGTAAGGAAARETLPPLPDFHRCPKGERGGNRQ